MKPWWERWPGRLEWEQKAFEDARLEFELDKQEFSRGRVVLRGRAPVAAGEFQDLVVVYPDIFPETRFTIFAPNLKLSRHQEPFHGNLCVFPRDSRYWQPQTTAAEIVKEQVPRLVALVRTGGDELRDAEFPQGEPFSTYFLYLETGGVIIPPQALAISDAVKRGTYVLRFRDKTDWIDIVGRAEPPNSIGSALLFEVQNDSGQTIAKADPKLAASFKGQTYKGHWARLSIPQDAPSPVAFIDNLINKLPKRVTQQGKLHLGNGRYDIPAGVFSEEVRRGEYGDSWLFCLLGQDNKGREQCGAFLRGMPFGPDLLEERIPELKPLRSKKVVIIGLGTLGAPLAAHMCKAQVGKLVLADPDYADPNTGVRWVNELDGAGAAKALILQQRLASDYAFTEIEAHRFRIGDASITRDAGASESALLEKMLTGADLVIDATAEENASNALSAVSREMGVTQISVFSIDGLGGVIARIRPGETGCLYCLELARAQDVIPWPKAAANEDTSRVQTRGCADPTFIGTSADLEPLVTQATSVAFGTLCRGVEGGYPELESADVFTLQLRNPDRGLLLPTWKAFKLPKDSKCPVCSVRK